MLLCDGSVNVRDDNFLIGSPQKDARRTKGLSILARHHRELYRIHSVVKVEFLQVA